MPDDELEDRAGRPMTVLDRLLGAALSEDRALEWITSGGARVDGEVIVDPEAPASSPSRVVLFPA